MAYEKKPMTGTLWKNKSANPKAPVLKGWIMTGDGEVLQVSAWPATSRDGQKLKDKNGETFLNLKLEQGDGERAERPPQREPDESDVPF